MTTVDKLNALPNPFIGINLPPKPARKPVRKPVRKPRK